MRFQQMVSLLYLSYFGVYLLTLKEMLIYYGALELHT